MVNDVASSSPVGRPHREQHGLLADDAGPAHLVHVPGSRGLHSSTFRLSGSAVYGRGGAFSGAAGGVHKVSRG